MSTTKKTLESYIQEARKVEPPQSVSKLRSAVENAATADAGLKLSHILLSKYGMLTMTGAIIVLASAIVIFSLNPDEITSLVEQRSQPEVQSEIQPEVQPETKPEAQQLGPAPRLTDAADSDARADESDMMFLAEKESQSDEGHVFIPTTDPEVLAAKIREKIRAQRAKSGFSDLINSAEIEGCRLLELNAAELRQIGIEYRRSELNCFYMGLSPHYYSYPNMHQRELLFPTPLEHPNDSLKITFSNSDEMMRVWFGAPVEGNEAYGFATPGIVPVCVMTYRDDVAAFWYLEDNATANAIFEQHGPNARRKLEGSGDIVKTSLEDPVLNIQTLLPIHFRLLDPDEDGVYPLDIILWYRADQTFIDLLPEHIAAELEEEREVLTSVVEEEGDFAVAGGGLAGDPYFDVWRSQSEAFTLEMLHPNPASELALATIQVREKQHLTVSLYDIFGRKVMHVQDLNAQAGFQGSIEVDTSETHSGIYLLAVTSETGERVVQRLIVQH